MPEPIAAPHPMEQPHGYNGMNSMPQGVRPYARVREDEVEQIISALKLNHGNKTRAALSLGLTPRQLRYRMKILNIPD